MAFFSSFLRKALAPLQTQTRSKWPHVPKRGQFDLVGRKNGQNEVKLTWKAKKSNRVPGRNTRIWCYLGMFWGTLNQKVLNFGKHNFSAFRANEVNLTSFWPHLTWVWPHFDPKCKKSQMDFQVEKHESNVIWACFGVLWTKKVEFRKKCLGILGKRRQFDLVLTSNFWLWKFSQKNFFWE